MTGYTGDWLSIWPIDFCFLVEPNVDQYKILLNGFKAYSYKSL